MSEDEIIYPQPPEEYLKAANIGVQWVNFYTKPIQLDSKSPVPNIGSCVLVEIGTRLFVVTAKHCISHNPYLMLKPVTMPCDPSSFLKLRLSPNRDIGFMEIVNDPAIPRLPVECLCTDLPIVPGNIDTLTERPTFISGYPADDLVRLTANHTGLHLTNFATLPVAITEDGYSYAWPISVAKYLGKSPVEKVLTEPYGFSGGGLWVVNEIPENGLTLPGNMLKLLAVQSRFDPTERLVKCIPIRWWIKLVYDKYPDLQERLAKLFPVILSVVP